MGELEARGVTIGYGDEVVVPQLSARLVAGSVTAIVGPNGSGKSTLLRALARLQRLQGGTVCLDGRDLATLPPREVARRLSFLPQAPLVPGGVTVRELVGYGRYPHQGLLARASEADAAAVAWALEVTGTTGFADRELDTMSGGERQRVWIAMALAQRSDLLLLDEPTTFLDIRYQLEVLRLVRQLTDEHGITVGVVLHDLNQAAAFADHMLLLSRGRVVACGAPADVVTAELIRTVFEADISVVTDPATGLPTCLPYRRPRRRHGLTAAAGVTHP